jgi:microcystin-dependent protein
MRAQRRQLNRQVQYDNRLATFTSPPVTTGDLYVTGNLHVGNQLRAKEFYASGNFYLRGFALVPPGTVIQSAAVNVPGGWLPCDGTWYYITDYPELFDSIQYTYGGEDDMFAVPDMRGRVAVGEGHGADLTNRPLAATGGEETHTLSVDEMPQHSHSSNAIGGSIGLITANGDNTAINTDNSAVEPNLWAALQALSIYNTGGSQAHNNMQPFVALRFLIKAF